MSAIRSKSRVGLALLLGIAAIVLARFTFDPAFQPPIHVALREGGAGPEPPLPAPLADIGAVEVTLSSRVDNTLELPFLKEVVFGSTVPFKDALEFFGDVNGIAVTVDVLAFEQANLPDILNRPVRIDRLDGVRMSLVRWLILRQVHAAYVVEDGRGVIRPLSQVPEQPERPHTLDFEKERQLWRKLNRIVTKAIVFDPNTPLWDALEFVSDVYEITIVIDEPAFAGRKSDIRLYPVQYGKKAYLPPRAVLSLLLAQAGATYEIVDDVILVVPGKATVSIADIIGDRVRSAGADLEERVVSHAYLIKDTFTQGQKALQDRLDGLKDEVAVAVAMDGLQAQDSSTRALAAAALAEFGTKAGSAAPALAAALKDENLAVRYQAVRALAHMGKRAEPAVKALATALSDNHIGVRSLAVVALGHVGPPARPAAGALGDALTNQSLGLRRAVLDTLEKMGPGATAALPAVRAAAKDPDPQVRDHARRLLVQRQGPGVLTEIGISQREIAAVLLEMLAGRDTTQLLELTAGLEQLGEEAVPEFIGALKRPGNETDWLHFQAGELLRRLGPRAHAAIPELIELLRGGQEMRVNRERAATILGAIGPAALPALLDVLTDKDPSSRSLAAEAIGSMGPLAEEARNAVIRAGAEKAIRRKE